MAAPLAFTAGPPASPAVGAAYRPLSEPAGGVLQASQPLPPGGASSEATVLAAAGLAAGISAISSGRHRGQIARGQARRRRPAHRRHVAIARAGFGRQAAPPPPREPVELQAVSTSGSGAAQTLRVLALERGGADVLVTADEAGHVVRLKRAVEGVWQAEANADLVVELGDMELAEALLGPDDGPSVYDMLPEWPEELADALSLWPLKGRGTIVFDAESFLERVAAIEGAATGPVMFVGAADNLALPTSNLCRAVAKKLKGKPLRQVLYTAGSPPQPLTYCDLLDVNENLRTGGLDLSRVSDVVDVEERRCVLQSQPYGFEVVPRRWTQGAVIRAVAPRSPADSQGCKPGDLIVSANGEDMLGVPISEVQEKIFNAEPPLYLEVVQPIVPDPIYLRESSLGVLRSLGNFRSAEAGRQLIPSLVEKFGEKLEFMDEEPAVFAGDEGSCSHVHCDKEPLIEACHVLSGVKLLVAALPEQEVPSGAGPAPCDAPWISRWVEDADSVAQMQTETSVPTDAPPSEEQAAWLCDPRVSIALGRPGDLIFFWGAWPHFGANALNAGPCVSLMHGCRRREE
eukprot:TRINITY_DN92575_c0_g1_i1.p1 TRINITY_DN92575_c0_g1~~TRINITY_DN92575_c0_g1_i1.p1  ORF type:complete len:573 (+),score=100.16 TRINITY_DN92575_c0_g1_i1:31-1749(+)